MKAKGLFLASLFLCSCTSLRYDDPDKVETVALGWGSTDLQTFASEMVDSLIRSPQLNYITGPGREDDARIVVYMGGIGNRTAEHIDTTGISDSIRVALLQSGKFRFTASQPGQDEIGEQVRFQQGSGRVDTEQAKAFGRQLGADVVLYGTLRSIEKSRDRSIETGGVRTDDLYYQFVLQCVNIESGELIWAEEKDLRKTEKRGIFGS